MRQPSTEDRAGELNELGVVLNEQIAVLTNGRQCEAVKFSFVPSHALSSSHFLALVHLASTCRCRATTQNIMLYHCCFFVRVCFCCTATEHSQPWHLCASSSGFAFYRGICFRAHISAYSDATSQQVE